MCNLSESILEQYRNKVFAEAFAEGFAESFAEGFAESFAEGFAEGEERMLKLCDYLIEKGLFDEIHKISSDSAYRENLLKSLGL